MKNSKIHINTKDIRFETAESLYGLFFEDINRAADGGLYPELIRNRAFEDSIPPAGCELSESGEIYLNDGNWPGSFMNGEGMYEWSRNVKPTPVPGWYAVNADMNLDCEDVLNDNRLAALDVHFHGMGYIENIGFNGILVKENGSYKLILFAKTNNDCEISAGIFTSEGVCIGNEVLCVEGGAGYKKYECLIQTEQTADKVTFRLISDKEAHIKLGFTSLMPTQTYKGHGLRVDLVESLKNTNSKFIRFPGGCVVEGINESNALRFSETIGPVWERPSSYLMWHYRTTNGLGYHEYLQLCEDINMDAMYVCNCGMSCQARKGKGFSGEIVNKYLEEALGAIEYALGDESKGYGAKRAANGHPEKFPLRYLEIGNENFGEEYNERYELFYEKIHEKYPELILIANNHVERSGLKTQIVDEHYYNTPEYFIENRNLFDDYDRNGPKIFIGEYAVNGGNTIGSLECALAEAVFLTGVEKNQDIVSLSAYAPLFQNSDYYAWIPNLIVFDHTRVYGIPSYYVLSLFAQYRGEKVIFSSTECEKIPPTYKGIPGVMCKKEGMKFKNAKINGKAVDISKVVYGEAVSENGEIELINGNTRHRYTGKNTEWNLAFEKFIGAGPEHDNPVLWAVFVNFDEREYEFEIDLKFDKDNPVTLSIWNYNPDTGAGCNEPRDYDWNIRSVRNQIWKIENGKSMLRSPGYFDKPLEADEISDISINYNEYNNYKIIASAEGYRCYLNGVMIQEKRMPMLPIVSEVATMDEKNIYLKVVNIGGSENEVEILLDCDIKEEYRVVYITGNPGDINNFDNPKNISVKEESRTGASRIFNCVIPANCVLVMIMEKKDENGN